MLLPLASSNAAVSSTPSFHFHHQYLFLLNVNQVLPNIKGELHREMNLTYMLRFGLRHSASSEQCSEEAERRNVSIFKKLFNKKRFGLVSGGVKVFPVSSLSLARKIDQEKRDQMTKWDLKLVS